MQRHGHTNVVQEGDEYVCRVCRKRWDMEDERNGDVPPCVPAGGLIEKYHIGAYSTRTHKTFAGRYQGFTFVEGKGRK